MPRILSSGSLIINFITHFEIVIEESIHDGVQEDRSHPHDVGAGEHQEQEVLVRDRVRPGGGKLIFFTYIIHLVMVQVQVSNS